MAYDLQLSLLHTDSFPLIERELLTVETSPITLKIPADTTSSMSGVWPRLSARSSSSCYTHM